MTPRTTGIERPAGPAKAEGGGFERPTLLFLGDCYPEAGRRVELPIDAPFVITLDAALGGARPARDKIVLLLDELDLAACFGSLPAAVNLASNHSTDGGEEGFARMTGVLRSDGVRFFGAGLPSDRWNNPARITVGGRKVDLFGYCAEEADPVYGPGVGPAPLELDIVRSDLARDDLGSSVKVVCVHWGFEEAVVPRWEDYEKAVAIVEAGADAVVGSHSHCVQPVIEVAGSVVAFGLGNACFGDLDVPSRYAEDGEPRGRFVKRQLAWNRQSVALEIDLATRAHTVWPMAQRGDVTRSGRGVHHRTVDLDPFRDRALYDRLAARDELRRARRAMLGRFLARPRVPRPSTLLTALGLRRGRGTGRA
jgi:hypothetical protein